MRRHRKGHPHVRADERRPAEARLRDADDGVRARVDADGAADDIPIGAETADPERVTEDGHRRAVRHAILIAEEQSSRRRAGAEHGEVVGRHGRSECSLRSALAIVQADGIGIQPEAGQPLDLCRLLQRQQHLVGHVVEPLPVGGTADVHQPRLVHEPGTGP